MTPRTPREIFEGRIARLFLSILVFGPDPKSKAKDTHTQRLRDKRIEIRTELRKDGHRVDFAEDIIDPTLPPPMADPFFQGQLLLTEYDLVFVLVYTPGSLTEAGMIAVRGDWAAKAHFFICSDLTEGYPYQACKHAEQTYHAGLTTYRYPTDITDCNLLKAIRLTVLNTQKVKFLNP